MITCHCISDKLDLMCSGFPIDVMYAKPEHMFLEFRSAEESQATQRVSYDIILQKKFQLEKATYRFEFSDILPSNGDVLLHLATRLWPGSGFSFDEATLACAHDLHRIWTRIDCTPKSRQGIKNILGKYWTEFRNRRKRGKIGKNRQTYMQTTYPFDKLFDVVTQKQYRPEYFNQEFYDDQRTTRMLRIPADATPTPKPVVNKNPVKEVADANDHDSGELVNGNAALQEEEEDKRMNAMDWEDERIGPRRSLKPSSVTNHESEEEDISESEEGEEDEDEDDDDDEDFEPEMDLDSDDEGMSLSYPAGTTWKTLDQLCRICNDKVLVTNGRKHLATVHNIEDLVCCFCPKTFHTVKHLQLHVLLNHPRRTEARTFSFNCKECDIPIIKPESYEHMFIEHGKKDECPFCPYKLENYDMNDVKLEDLVDLNNISLSPRKKLKRHVVRSHKFKPDRPADSDKTAEVVMQCKWCHESFSSMRSLIEHKNKKVDPTKRQVPLCLKLPDQSFEDVKKTICNFCGLSVSTNSKAYRRHLAQFHDIDKDEVFNLKCPNCEEAFADSLTFKRHLLNKHLQPKTPKRFKRLCPRCDQAFPRKEHVVNHLRAKHYPLSFECLVCNKRFHLRPHVRKHLNRKHGIQLLDGYLMVHPTNIEEDIKRIQCIELTQESG